MEFSISILGSDFQHGHVLTSIILSSILSTWKRVLLTYLCIGHVIVQSITIVIVLQLRNKKKKNGTTQVVYYGVTFIAIQSPTRSCKIFLFPDDVVGR